MLAQITWDLFFFNDLKPHMDFKYGINSACIQTLGKTISMQQIVSFKEIVLVKTSNKMCTLFMWKKPSFLNIVKKKKTSSGGNVTLNQGQSVREIEIYRVIKGWWDKCARGRGKKQNKKNKNKHRSNNQLVNAQSGINHIQHICRLKLFS